ncbi:MAG: flavin reductase [Firmicutes bacterium]|nr:flavin reductase [Bacillota bacterium]
MRRWRCTVCGYVHIGSEPPETCPVCGAGREAFVDEGPAAEREEAFRQAVMPVLWRISYGLYILGVRHGDRANVMTTNTLIQVAEDPLLVTVAVNKGNLSWEFLRANPVAAVSILSEEGYALARHCGLQSGRRVDKLAGIPHRPAGNGCPIIIGPASLGFLELSLVPGAELDAGTHTVFLARITNGATLGEGRPLTYARYQEIKKGAGLPGGGAPPPP